MSDVLSLLIAILLVGLCGLFVAAEFAFLTVSRPAVDRAANKGDRQLKGVREALRTLSTQLSGAQVGITMTNLAIGFLAQPTIAHLLHDPLQSLGLHATAAGAMAVVIGVIIATTITMIFGELIPKNTAIARPLATARVVQGWQRGFSAVMRRPIRLLNGSANFILRRFGVEPQEELASARSADELSSLVQRSAEKGTLSVDTARMFARSLAFGDLTAVDVMTPRIRVYTILATEPVYEVIELAKRTGLSRFPVVKTNLDDVVGIIHVKQAVAVPTTDRKRTPVEQVMRPPIVVPSSIQLEPLLETLRGGGLQLAVVIDEFGGADGIVTVEDLIEELVGEVTDEHDEANLTIRQQDKNGWIMSGLLRPDEVGQELDIYLPDEEEFETIGGLIADRLEHIPKVNDSVAIVGKTSTGRTLHVRLTVLRMDGRRVDRLHLEQLAQPDEGETI